MTHDESQARAIRRTALRLGLVAAGFYVAFVAWTWMQ